jgi:hypothetical protein
MQLNLLDAVYEICPPEGFKGRPPKAGPKPKAT